MNSENSLTKPLPRSLTVLLVLLLLTAFLPHRERALLLTEQGFETVLASRTLEGNSFISPAPFGYYDGKRLNWWPTDGGSPDGLRRARSGPGRTLVAQALPTALPTIPGVGSGPNFIPLGGGIPDAAPVASSTGATPGGSSGGPGSSIPGAIGSLPGGGGGGGGGSITPPTTPVPPIAVVPEPAMWAFMILGFGVIGSALRRARRGERVRISG
jgi:PEP-CTERM motif